MARCDYKGPCVVVAWTQAGLKFGGFTPAGFMSSDDYTATWGAFLICFPDGAQEPTVLRKVASSAASTLSSQLYQQSSCSPETRQQTELGPSRSAAPKRRCLTWRVAGRSGLPLPQLPQWGVDGLVRALLAQ